MAAWWFEPWVYDRVSSPGPNPTCITRVSIWSEGANSHFPQPLEESFGLTALGIAEMSNLGCRHDIDVLIMLAREARTLRSLREWLTNRAPADLLNEVVDGFAGMIENRICPDFYDLN